MALSSGVAGANDRTEVCVCRQSVMVGLSSLSRIVYNVGRVVMILVMWLISFVMFFFCWMCLVWDE